MKVGKKLLSVFLAVIMIMSSMSVCFGVFAANLGGDYSGYTSDPFSYLATHLNGQTITDVANSVNIGNGGSGGTGSNTTAVYYTTNITLATYEQFCEVRDVLIYLDKAIKGSSPWGKTVNTQDSQSGACAGAEDIYNDVVKRIEKYETLTSQGKEFIKYVLDYSKAKHHDKAEEVGKKGLFSWNSPSKTPSSHQTTVNISTSDYKGYLAEAGEHTNVATSIELGYTYNFYMSGTLYYSTTSWGVENKRYYHHMVWLGSNPINAPSVNKSDTTTKTKLNTFVNTVDNTITANTFEVMAGMTLAEIEALEKKLDDARTTVKAYVNNDGLDNYATLFPGYDDKIATFKETAAKAKEISKYRETVAEITAYQKTNSDYGVFNWGGFDEATIKADYADFMGKYGSIINDSTLYEFFVNEGSISKTYIDNFKDNVVAYDLEDLRIEKVDPLYNKFALSNPDLDGEEITFAEKQAAYSEITGYLGNIRSYTAQVQNAIFPEGLDHLLDFQEKLECQVADCVLYFAENVNKDYSDVSTEDVLIELSRAKANLSALNSLLASVDYAANAALLDSSFDNADTFIAYLYSLLAERFTAQVNAADDAYNALERPTSLDLSAFSKLNVYLNAIEENILTFIDSEGKNTLITAETRAKYNALKAEVFPAFEAFKVDRGFKEYSPSDILIRREDNPDEIFRVNENRDDDILGEYEVTEENVEAIIDLLEAALKDPTIAKLLGDLINKDEEGNPTGEAFDLASLLSGLIEGIYSDDLINTIVSFIYPAVANIFSNVWAGINPVINDSNMDVMGQKVAVYAVLDLFTVEQATAGLGVPLFPKELAAKIRSSYPAFTNVADVLDDATTKAIVTLDADGNPIESTRKSPWNDAVLYTAKLDKDNNPVINEETGEATMVLNLDWGIDELEGNAKRERFLDAAQAALCGLEPLLLALLCNREMAAFNSLIGTGEGELDNFYVDALGGINLWDIALDVYQIDLALNATANDGYNNVIAPLFEMLGLTAPDGRTFTSTREVLKKGLFEPLDAFIAKLSANPVKTLLDVLPNLAYAAEADLLLTKLSYLGTTISYSAGAYIDADVNVGKSDYWLPVTEIIDSISGIVSGLIGLPMENGVIKGVRLDDVVSGTMPVEISSFLDINALLGDGVDLSSFAGIWNLIAGLVPMLADVPVFDAAYLSTLGTLVEIDTVRSIKAYTAGAAGKAYHINANRADVLQYLIKWVLESGLLDGLVQNPDELVAGIFANLENNSTDAIAAIVELLTQKTVYDAKTYSWYDGIIDGESVVGNSAYEIYLNPGNDWTEAKAEYLYENLESLVATILTLAKVDLDKNTPEAETLDQFIGGAIDGLLGDKTLTALAGALGKLDLNALLAPKADAEAGEGENATTPDASEPETVAEGEGSAEGEEGEEGEEETEAAAPALDIEALLNSLLGIDLSTFRTKYGEIAAKLEADETYVYNFGVDGGDKTFAEALAEIIAPFEDVINFILVGGNLEIKLGTETVTLLGSNGYNNAIIPLLEALGCDVTAFAELGETTALEATINALLAKLEDLTNGHFIKNVIDLLPGLLYFITSNGLSTTVLNLLQPVLVIADTIKPVIDLIDVIGNIEIGEEGAKQKLVELLGVEKLDLEHLDVNFVVDLVKALTGLDLAGLENLIYDVVKSIGSTTYTSKSTLQTEWKKAAAYSNETFDQADMLTVLLSFVLEWATVKENAEALDTLLGTEGLIASITTALAGVDIKYADPDWMYWFETEEAFNEYIAGNADLPNTLLALEYPNDWDEATAKTIASQLPDLVDMVIGLINAEKGEDAPKTLSALLNGLIAEKITADTVTDLVHSIADLLGGIDATLIETAGVLLDANIAGLSTYTCEAEIDSLGDFINELAVVLDTYAGRVIDWLFFGEAYEFARKSTTASTIVINGGNGYEEGLALILEALGAEVPDPATATTATALGALATRVEAILANPVAEILDILPNLIYFLNANGAGVAVSNILAPVVSLIDALAIEGVKLDLAELIKIEKKDADGNKIGEVKLNLGALTLGNIVNFVEELTGLDLVAVENILVDFCVGKIVKTAYGYKMVADRDDVVTILLTTALSVVNTEGNAAVLDKLIGQNIIGKIKAVFESSAVNYVSPEWYALDWNDVDYENQTIGVVQSAISYPNDWSAEASLYIADNLGDLVDKVIALINNGKEDAPKTLADLIEAKVNIYTPDLLMTIQKALADLIGGLEGDLAELVNVGLGVADSLLGANVQGLLNYNVGGVKDKKTFVAALTGVLMEVEGLVDWLLFGENYEFFVDDKNDNDEYDAGEAIVTLNGAAGYEQGLSLILEALGVVAPAVIKDEKGVVNTEATVSAVLTAVFDRVDAVLADPVDEAMNMLPNIIYFINANGLAAAVNNLAGAFNTLAFKLKALGLDITLNNLVNIEKMLNIEKDLAISLDNLTLAAVLELVAELTGLDLSKVADIFVGFALGRVQGYTGVNGKDNAKMVYDEGEKGRFNKGDMMTLIVTAALRVIDNKNNAAVLDELIGSEIISALETVFAGGSVTYSEINWNYAADDDGEYMLKYPNNWNEETAIAVTDVLLNGDIQALIAGLIDKNYDSLGDLLTDKVNVFTSDNLQAVVDFIANLLKDIDDGLLEAAGVLLGANIVGLKSYKAPAGITTVKAFAAELANVLTTYAPGVVEWLLLGRDYKFFVKDDANGITVDAITIKGANGYTEGLAVLLEALGVVAPAVIKDENDVVNTEATVAAVLGAVADRINEIFANPVEEVIELLPNVIYFLNTDGVAVVVDNTIAAITALLGKIETFGLKVDINSLVDLPKLMGVADKYEEGDDVISLDNITISSLLTAVSYMVEDLDLTVIEKVLVGFNLGETAPYTTISATEAGKAMKMTCDAHDTVTIIANLLLITIADEDNAEFLKELMGEEIYGMIMELFDMTMVDIQEFSWMYTSEETGGNKVGETFTTLETSEEYEDWPMYGPFYTEEMATYIAENFGMFVDNILYLLGLEINGITVDNLTDLINGLLDGSLYTADNVIKIRDALAGVLANLENLEVNGKKVGGHIIDVLKTAKVADLRAVGAVQVAAFNEEATEREQFVAALCDVLEPLYPVLKYLLAKENFSFFVDEAGKDLITLKGAEGYAYGILPLLEALDCQGILAPAAYYDAVKANGDVIITSILNPLLDRVDEIIADPANEILEILPNIIYFINSNGVDTVVKNTLNAVYSLLKVIEPIAKINLYEIIGIDFSTINMNWLLDKAVELLVNAGYAFTREDLNPILELTVGKLEGYTSLNGKQAYRMVYATSDVEGEVVSGGKEELVSIILRLGISFLMHENNADVLVDLLVEKLGMDPDAETYVRRLVKSIAAVPTTTYLGMNQAQAVIYYLFYSADIGSSETVQGFKDIGAEWGIILNELGGTAPDTIGGILNDLLGDDVIDSDRFAPSGLIGFFQKIIDWFNKIIEWFKNLFN